MSESLNLNIRVPATDEPVHIPGTDGYDPKLISRDILKGERRWVHRMRGTGEGGVIDLYESGARVGFVALESDAYLTDENSASTEAYVYVDKTDVYGKREPVALSEHPLSWAKAAESLIKYAQKQDG